jgi:ankyrin repeat protein
VLGSLAVLVGTTAIGSAQPPKPDTPATTVTAPNPAGPPNAGPGGPPPGDPLGSDLYRAIKAGEVKQVNALLERGAQPNAENWLGITPLIWASLQGNDAIVSALLAHKANAKVDTIYGGALEFAALGGSASETKLLLNNGATFTKLRKDKITEVMVAADTGHMDVLNVLLTKKPNINATDASGMTALMFAVRHDHLPAVTQLVAAGASLNAADSWGRSALMYAAMNGHTPSLQYLIQHHADINQKDKNGDTALILAAKYSGAPRIAQLLRGAGADTSVKDARGRTAQSIALAHTFTDFAAVLSGKSGNRHLSADTRGVSLSERANHAVLASLPLIEKTAMNFSMRSGCASCHHEGLGALATGTAQGYGYRIDALLATTQEKTVLAMPEGNLPALRQLVPHPEMYKHFPTMDMNEFTPGVGFQFVGLLSHQVARSEAIEGMTTMLARQQLNDGGWGYGFERAPMQSSRFAMTAYTLRVLPNYLPESLATERMARISHAISWLKTTPAITNEDRAFKVLALKWGGADTADIQQAVAELIRGQGSDGGWAQFNAQPSPHGYGKSDAYATGIALYALHVGGGMPTTDKVYVKGSEYLLSRQDDDGSWFVNKRALPANNFLDTGFPHGESQYISFGATCWSTMALFFAAHPEKTTPEAAPLALNSASTR